MAASPSSDYPLSLSPIDWQGKVDASLQPITNAGDKELDLRKYKLLALDWQTDNRQPTFAQVENLNSTYNLGPPLQSETSDLASCLHLFTEPEVLDVNEAWYCPQCKKHREATKRMMVWQLPEILILQLKRFSFKNFIWRDKIDMFIDFPIRGLDMSRFCVNSKASGPQLYDLFAVVNHHGGIFGGHYTSYVRLPKLDNSTEDEVGWRLCDDSHVRKVSSEEQVVSKAAYVILYRRRKMEPSFPEVPLTSLQRNINHDEAATTSAQVRDRSGSVTPPRSRAENDLQDPSTTNNSPSSTSSLYEDASESMADDEQPSESGSEPYFLTACFSGDYDHAASVDTITGEPLIKYSELFDPSGELISGDGQNLEPTASSFDTSANSGAGTVHSLSADQSRGDGQHVELMECGSSGGSPAASRKNPSGTSCDHAAALPYTDMDAID